MAIHSRFLAWSIPFTEQPGGLQSIESQSQTQLSMCACMLLYIRTYLSLLAPCLSCYQNIVIRQTFSQIPEGQITSCYSDLNAHSANMLTCFFFKKKLLECSCFTMWCQFLLYSKVNQLCVYVHALFLDFLLIQVTTDDCVEFPTLQSRFGSIIYFIHSINSIYIYIYTHYI